LDTSGIASARARVACNEQVGSFEFIWIHLRDVSISLHVRPVPSQYIVALFVSLYLPDWAHPCPVKAQVSAADSRK
jgi:hypothetical protein